MKAVAEPQSWLLRWYEHDDAGPRDPYLAFTTVTIDEYNIATLRGFNFSTSSREMWNAANDELWRLGAREAVCSRWKNGMSRVVRVKLKPPDS